MRAWQVVGSGHPRLSLLTFLLPCSRNNAVGGASLKAATFKDIIVEPVSLYADKFLA
jgi:hypothetical protein